MFILASQLILIARIVQVIHFFLNNKILVDYFKLYMYFELYYSLHPIHRWLNGKKKLSRILFYSESSEKI